METRSGSAAAAPRQRHRRYQASELADGLKSLRARPCHSSAAGHVQRDRTRHGAACHAVLGDTAGMHVGELVGTEAVYTQDSSERLTLTRRRHVGLPCSGQDHRRLECHPACQKAQRRLKRAYFKAISACEARAGAGPNAEPACTHARGGRTCDRCLVPARDKTSESLKKSSVQ